MLYKKTLLLLLLISLFYTAKGKELLFPEPKDGIKPKIKYLGQIPPEIQEKEGGFLEFLIGKDDTFEQMDFVGKIYGVISVKDFVFFTDTTHGIVLSYNLLTKSLKTLNFPIRLSLPMCLAYSKKLNVLFVSDAKLKKVFGFNKDGKLVFAVGKRGEFKKPVGIAVDDRLERVYIVDTFGHKVKVYDFNGNFIGSFGKRGDKDGEFNFPTNIAINRNNSYIYITDTQMFRVQVFNKDFEHILTIGGNGNIPGRFSRPKGIGVDSDGNIYVVDAAFNNIQVFNIEGEVLYYIGEAGTEPAKFLLPAGLYVDDKDRIFVVDSLNKRIQIFQYLKEKR
ncbi:6-bladed beta-propeller [Persephonella sp. IF05-L8]|uniref:6-bladed beta-propeller n=1 Tax=Persephonella sp. IF05-L8 TaxID=1158338 RepID=UPI0006919AE5